MTTDKLGIYIHIPFCASRCYYCDFCSQSTRDTQKMVSYTDALINEIKTFADKQSDKKEVDTVYFGGGTPTLLPCECTERILACVHERFCVSDNAEISVEANPKTADGEKLSFMRALGINRLSIGMQSVHDSELKALGRIHKFSDFEMFFKDARRAGFDNISVDLMYGIPDQTLDSFRTSLETLAKMSPNHISSYCLKIEEGTRFFDKRDSLCLPDEDTSCEMYELMSKVLSEYSYYKYEISNFAKAGYESRHNTKYWSCDGYVGFGSSAHSYFEHERYANSRDIDEYINTCGLGCVESRELIGAREAENEFVMLGMRLARGICISDYENIFKKPWQKTFGVRFQKFIPEYVTDNGKNCAFTDKGMLVSNYILSEVLDF